MPGAVTDSSSSPSQLPTFKDQTPPARHGPQAPAASAPVTFPKSDKPTSTPSPGADIRPPDP